MGGGAYNRGRFATKGAINLIQSNNEAMETPSGRKWHQPIVGCNRGNMELSLPRRLEKLIESFLLKAFVTKDHLQARHLSEKPSGQMRGLLAIVKSGTVHQNRKQKAHCIDHDMSFASGDLFASIESPGVADVRGRDALTVDDCCRRAWFSPDTDPGGPAQRAPTSRWLPTAGNGSRPFPRG